MFTLLLGVPVTVEFLTDALAGVPRTLRNGFSSLLSAVTFLGGVCKTKVEGGRETTERVKNMTIFNLI